MLLGVGWVPIFPGGKKVREVVGRPDIARVSSIIEKSQSRYVAKHSVRNSIAYTATVGMAHWFVDTFI